MDNPEPQPAPLPTTPTQPAAPTSDSTPPTKKSRKWKIFFILLALGNTFTIILPFLVILLLAQQAESGVSGTEFIGILLIPLFVLGYLVAILNIVSILIYLRKKRPTKKITIYGLLVVFLSILYVGSAVVTTYVALTIT